jgi:hypothetical protein
MTRLMAFLYNLGTDRIENTTPNNFVYCCACIRCSGNVLTQPLPRNGPCNHVTILQHEFNEWRIEILFMVVQTTTIRGLRACQERLPHRRYPNHKIFAAIDGGLRQTGIFKHLADSQGSERSVRMPDVEERVEENPGVSTTLTATELNVEQIIVRRALHGELLYPYLLWRFPRLKPAVSPAPDSLCRWFVQPCTEPPFLLSVLFSEEDVLDREGIANFQNHH